MELDKDLAARQEARILAQQAEIAAKQLADLPQEKSTRITLDTNFLNFSLSS